MTCYLYCDTFETTLFGIPILANLCKFPFAGSGFCTIRALLFHGTHSSDLSAKVTIINTATTPVNPIIFRFLRIGKLVRAVRMVTMTSTLAPTKVTEDGRVSVAAMSQVQMLLGWFCFKSNMCDRDLSHGSASN